MNQIQKNYDAAQRNLSRICEERSVQHGKLKSLEQTLVLAEKAQKQEHESAILENRKPNAKRTKEIEDLKTQIAEAESSVSIYARATERATQQVDQLAGELREQELQILREQFAPAAEKLFQAIEILTDAASGIRQTLEKAGPANLLEVLFPMRDPGRAERGALETRGAYMAAFQAGIAILNLREAGKLNLYDRERELAAA